MHVCEVTRTHLNNELFIWRALFFIFHSCPLWCVELIQQPAKIFASNLPKTRFTPLFSCAVMPLTLSDESRLSCLGSRDLETFFRIMIFDPREGGVIV